MMADYCWYWKR